MTQLGGDDTYAWGTGKALGPPPAITRRQLAGSQQKADVGSHLPCWEEHATGNHRLPLPPGSRFALLSLELLVCGRTEDFREILVGEPLQL